MLRRTLVPIAVAVAALGVLAACGSSNDTPAASSLSVQNAAATATPIKHVVVIYGENVSFDHYFATYPNATNPTGEPVFTAAAGTPSVNGLSGTLLTANPNATNVANGAGATNPFRLDRTQAATADQNHAYTAEEQAYDNGLMDLFPKYTGRGTSGGAGAFGTTGQVMGYYDGNTVTALWNYAQNYAMSDNAFTDTYGPSTPGALEAIAGQTNGMQIVKSSRSSYYVADGQGGFTMINDVDPGADVCSSTTDQAMMTGKNIGDLLNAKNITWGGFMGGFNLSTTNANGTTGCARSTTSTVVGAATADYIPHHNWFQYYASTANPQHLRPASMAAVGYTTAPGATTADPANHQYDSDDFFAAVKAGNFPSVSFLKAPAYQDGHAGYSDPLDEQAFVTKVVNFLQQQPDWKNTAVLVAWDDSDGWYDHAYVPPTSASFSSADMLNGTGVCGTGTAPLGVNGQPVNGRCGPGTRIPFLVISPYAKKNFVDHTAISQASIVRFIEDNWLGGQRIGGGSFDASAGSINSMFDFSSAARTTPLFLDPNLGTQVSTAP
ncbi:alkaline phosphatase family protein [Trinickia sp. Y13]|uniref:phospholipase C n=1 Tax=Trinickia sp. Y13 TaxID=2917807 RepID=UPI00240700DB|nr:alkaline phosphatase family protein [Trinickia sp. Y13]MDG0024448.1 alkaline phosphatase family protein [Trinickia sp. Y13]